MIKVTISSVNMFNEKNLKNHFKKNNDKNFMLKNTYLLLILVFIQKP